MLEFNSFVDIKGSFPIDAFITILFILITKKKILLFLPLRMDIISII